MAGGNGPIWLQLALGAANAITSGIYAGTSGKHMKRMIAELQSAINNDITLKNKLMDAYNSKNFNAVNNIISTVPGGMANKVAKLEKELKEAVHRHKMEQIDKNIADNTARSEALNQHAYDPYNQVNNMVNTIWFDKNKHNLGASKIPSNKKDEFIIKDQYGKDNKVNLDQLESWTYSSTKPKQLETVERNKNQSITTVERNR